MKRIAIIGTQGIPAHYGGFETLAENLVRKKHNNQIEYTVFCSSKDLQTDGNVFVKPNDQSQTCLSFGMARNRRMKSKEFLGAKLKYLNLHSNGIQSILYDIVSMIKCIRGYDALLILGVSGCVFIPILKVFAHTKIVVNIDGLEHKRQKWGKIAKWFLRQSEKMAVRYADTIIADNPGIREYVKDTYNKDAVMIAYGGDHALIDMTEEKEKEILDNLGLEKGGYALSICRIEPENNVDMVLDVFAETNKPIAIVGNFQNNEYSRGLRDKYSNHHGIKLIDACYDTRKLYVLRKNAGYYVHGHSAGGTNPSLVEVMHFGIPVITFDVNYNRYTTNNEAEYFADRKHLEYLLKMPRKDSGGAMKDYADKNYRWDIIAQEYEQVLLNLS